MPHSKASTAKSAPDAGTPDAGSKPRPRVGRRTSAGTPAPMNGITITRRGLALALGILGGAYMLQWDRTSGVEAQVRDLRGDLHTEINGLRQDVRADIRDLRQEIGTLREQVREIAIFIRTRDAAVQ